VVICLEQGADLHMAQLMPLSLTVSCVSKIQIGFTFLVPAHPGSPGQRAVKTGVCVSSPHRPFLSSFPTAFPLPEIQSGVPGNAVSSPRTRTAHFLQNCTLGQTLLLYSYCLFYCSLQSTRSRSFICEQLVCVCVCGGGCRCVCVCG